ncbi:NmrA-like family protein [Exophiala viscosa]|uniref:NmrA-like family protein n=1 Tax=Exophiala viscosa TaxID=2486360 RepID=UPI002197E6B9|nr:NmrA-like family protein [Exophiala viscosa]
MASQHINISKVAIVGANGKVGPFILQAILDTKSFHVTVLNRKSSKSTYSSDVKVAQIDDTYQHEQLVETLRGQDALIIAFPGTQSDNSIKLADAAFEAGVKLVIPSDFGSCDSSDPRSLDLIPLYGNKKDVRDYLIKLSQQKRDDGSHLAWTSLITGHFFDYGLRSGLLNIDVKKRTARVFDDGKARFSNSTLADIGLATAKVLQHTGDARLKNKLVYSQSLSTTQNDLIAAVEKVIGAKIDIEEVSSEEYIQKNKAQLTGKGDDGEATEELVSVEGIVNADWEKKGDAFVNEVLGMPKRTLDQLVKEALA